MSKLIEAAVEFLARDTSTKQSKREIEESLLLSQEEFASLSEEDQEQYVNQLMELKKETLKSYMGKAAQDVATKNFRAGAMIASRKDNKDALRDMSKGAQRMQGMKRAADKM